MNISGKRLKHWVVFLSLFTASAVLIRLEITFTPRFGSLNVRNSLLEPFRFLTATNTSLGGMFRSVIYGFTWEKDKNSYIREIGSMKVEIAALKSLGEENANLKRMLDIKNNFSYDLLFARIIKYNPGNWTHSLVIDRGSADGVRPEMVALSAESDEVCLAGKVTEIRDNHSEILLITDQECGVAVTIMPGAADGIMMGKGDGLCRIKYLPLNASIKPGDQVIVSGKGGVYNYGLKVGKIEKVIPPSEFAPYLEADVRPSLTSYKLSHIYLIKGAQQ